LYPETIISGDKDSEGFVTLPVRRARSVSASWMVRPLRPQSCGKSALLFARDIGTAHEPGSRRGASRRPGTDASSEAARRRDFVSRSLRPIASRGGHQILARYTDDGRGYCACPRFQRNGEFSPRFDAGTALRRKNSDERWP